MELINGNILIVDDDRDVLNTAIMFLKQKFKKVAGLEDPAGIQKLISKSEFDVILLDMNFKKGDMEGLEGIYWLKKIREIDQEVTVIMITAYGDIKLAVETMREGASDFLLKPWKNEKLYATILAALELKKSKIALKKLKGAQERIAEDMDKPFAEIIGDSPAMNRVFELITKVADTDANVLILGENGTGKELVARALHRMSSRRSEVFIRVDLGSLTETLFESELFGHVKGAFTDAKSERAGSFELASGGTIFLDEIGNLSLPLQAKLLTAIQNKLIKRVGSNKEISIDARLICATNMPLYSMAEKEKTEFRQDLLYRINTVEIRVPSLRDRQEDIPLLAKHYLQLYNHKYGRKDLKIDPSLLKKMASYSWPGNVRELQHAIEKAVILSDGKRIEDRGIIADRAKTAPESEEPVTLEDMEKIMIERSVQKNKGNLSKVAGELGITRATLYRKMEKFDI
jgi:DNA-binding NtrC family response regulator